MRQSKYPPGWDEDRVQRVMAHYEQQSEEEAVAEDEAALEDEGLAVMEVPKELVPTIREMIVLHETEKAAAEAAKADANAARRQKKAKRASA